MIKYSQNFDAKDNYKRFFRNDDWEGEIEDIFDKSLYEFPVFGLNETYLKAIGNVLSIKVKQIYMLKKQTLDIFDNAIEQENIKQNQLNDIKKLMRSDFTETKPIHRPTSTLDRA